MNLVDMWYIAARQNTFTATEFVMNETTCSKYVFLCAMRLAELEFVILRNLSCLYTFYIASYIFHIRYKKRIVKQIISRNQGTYCKGIMKVLVSLYC